MARFPSSRRGISLLEVLISIFVLAVGLLGVAALIPAGRHEIAQGSRLDSASMVGRAAFRDLKVRGYLNPTTWQHTTATLGWYTVLPTTGTLDRPFVVNTDERAQVAVVLDPLGVAANYDATLVKAPLNPITPHVLRITPMNMGVSVADSVFRSSFDLMSTANTTNDELPPEQMIFGADSLTRPASQVATAVRRASEGNYSWMATIVSDPANSAARTGKVTVSVAVFHKRDLSAANAGEYLADAELPSPGAVGGVGVGGGDVKIVGIDARKTIRSGEWLMLVARRPPPDTYNYFRWYRVVSAGPKNGSQQMVTLAGADWDPKLLQPADTFAYLFDNIVAVYEKTMQLED